MRENINYGTDNLACVSLCKKTDDFRTTEINKFFCSEKFHLPLCSASLAALFASLHIKKSSAALLVLCAVKSLWSLIFAYLREGRYLGGQHQRQGHMITLA